MFLVISGTSKHNTAIFHKCFRIVVHLLSHKHKMEEAAVVMSVTVNNN